MWTLDRSGSKFTDINPELLPTYSDSFVRTAAALNKHTEPKTIPHQLSLGQCTVKSRLQYALAYNTQFDSSLLSTGKTQVHVYNTHRLLLKSFQ